MTRFWWWLSGVAYGLAGWAMGHVETPEPEGMRGRVLDRMQRAAILDCYGPLNRVSVKGQDASDD